MNNTEWLKNAKYGLMLHFGLYSLLGGEYKGRRVKNYAEWAQSYFRIPNSEYEKLMKVFNPIYFDAEEYVRLARDCGMQYIVITSKHHDGFCLFDSKVDSYNVKNTPFGRDIVAELSLACKKYGLKLGIYYSQDLDWHHPHGGGYNTKSEGAGTSACNDWDFPDNENKSYDICLKEKILPQIKELLTNYGEICLMWFDVPETSTLRQSKLIYDTVKSLQPECLVNSRLGQGMYDYVALGDNEIPETREEWQEMCKRDPKTIDYRDVSGFKPSPTGIYESAATLNDTWGFSYYDVNWRSPEQIAAYRKRLNELGINYLINIGPDPLGRIPTSAEMILRKAVEL